MGKRFDVLADTGATGDQDHARSIVLREAGLNVFPSNSVPPLRTEGIRDEDIADATRRVVGVDVDVAQPVPPQPGESDDDIANRHRKEIESSISQANGAELTSGPRTLPSDVQTFIEDLQSRPPKSPV